MELGDWFILAAVIVALGIGVASILHTQRLQRKEHRERLLNEIIEWAKGINKASLTPDIPLSSRFGPTARKQRAANELFRYADRLSDSVSIETIAMERFRTELLHDVRKVSHTLSKYICIKQLKDLGTLPSKEGLNVEALEEINKEINEGKKSTAQLWEEYSSKLANSTRDLLFKANRIKANLLK